jgi:hypothetical protein
LRFVTERGFATVSSALIALPGLDRGEVAPVFRYRTWQPMPEPWRDIRA